MLRLTVVMLAALVAAIVIAQEPATIANGDRLRLLCEEEPQLNKEYSVNSQGLILVDFLGAVRVAGLTEVEAAERIATQLIKERILRSATVTVQIIKHDPAPIRYQGKVTKTGEMPFRSGIRLADVILLAGATEETDLARILIVTDGTGRQYVDYTRFDPATNENNPLLRPGDVVTFFAKLRPDQVIVLGGVERPGAIDLSPGMTVRMAIQAAGGFSALALPAAVKLDRNGEARRTLDLSTPGPDVELRGGDRVFVEVKSSREYVQVVGAVVKGGFIEFRHGMTVSQAIEAAGGLRPDAKPTAVRIVRSRTNRSIEVIDLTKVANGTAVDVTLNAGNRVEVDGYQSQKLDLVKMVATLVLLYFLLSK